MMLITLLQEFLCFKNAVGSGSNMLQKSLFAQPSMMNEGCFLEGTLIGAYTRLLGYASALELSLVESKLVVSTLVAMEVCIF